MASKPPELNPRSQSDAEQQQGDWAQFDREIAEFSLMLDLLRKSEGEVGSELVHDLEARFEAIQAQATALKEKAAQAEIAVSEQSGSVADALKDKYEQAKDTMAEQSEKMADQARVTGAQLKDAAGDVGEGFERAWQELRDAISAAAEKIRK